MLMMETPQIAMLCVALLLFFYLLYWLQLVDGGVREKPSRQWKRCPRDTEPDWPEYFTDNGGDAAAVPEQSAVDFSDILVTDNTRQETQRAQEDKNQIQTINDRFRAAKPEHTFPGSAKICPVSSAPWSKTK